MDLKSKTIVFLYKIIHNQHLILICYSPVYLEKVGQYLKDEDLKQPPDLTNNIWNQLLSTTIYELLSKSLLKVEY